MKVETLKLMKSVDFFSGAGGLSCGLQMAGFESVLGSDIYPVYAETFARNHPGTTVITKDIRELSEHDILELTGLKPGELDLIAGGPPCQGFSVNAPIRSLAACLASTIKNIVRNQPIAVAGRYSCAC